MFKEMIFMFEFVQLKGNTYCYKMPTNVGFYVTENNSVYVIDTGINERSAKRIERLVNSKGWQIEAVILTHAHTDHAGGCKYLCESMGCKAYATEAERVFVQYPDLEPAVVYGAFPCRDFRGLFMNTPACKVYDICELVLPAGFELLHLPGHFADMIGVRTPDDVYFLADGVIGRQTLEKSPMSYIFDVESQYKTLENLEKLCGKLCVPSHSEPTNEIAQLVQFNIECLDKVNKTLLDIIYCEKSVEDIVSQVTAMWELPDTYMQYVLTCSGVRTHLTYLRHKGLVQYEIKDGRMLWSKA